MIVALRIGPARERGVHATRVGRAHVGRPAVHRAASDAGIFVVAVPARGDEPGSGAATNRRATEAVTVTIFEEIGRGARGCGEASEGDVAVLADRAARVVGAQLAHAVIAACERAVDRVVTGRALRDEAVASVEELARQTGRRHARPTDARVLRAAVPHETLPLERQRERVVPVDVDAHAARDHHDGVRHQRDLDENLAGREPTHQPQPRRCARREGQRARVEHHVVDRLAAARDADVHLIELTQRRIARAEVGRAEHHEIAHGGRASDHAGRKGAAQEGPAQEGQERASGPRAEAPSCWVRTHRRSLGDVVCQ